MLAPGRSCPTDYRYAPRDLKRAAEFSTGVLYAVGGLYGNPYALDAILALAEAEPDPPRLVFNGDFNWFNADPDAFRSINRRVLALDAIRGNVETEIFRDRDSVGCGCAYPEWVPDGVVERSNRIMQRLRNAGHADPGILERLAELPMFRVAQVGGVRVGLVHGDAWSLAGWNFSVEALDGGAAAAFSDCFREADVRIFASSHTCLPVLRQFAWAGADGVVVNNGSAGMPNFRGTRFGVVTRIATSASPPGRALYCAHVGGVVVEALPVHYDHARWQKAFLANWPVGSPAFESYFDRIQRGPDYGLEHARPASPGVGAAGSCAAVAA